VIDQLRYVTKIDFTLNVTIGIAVLFAAQWIF
jgi:hypothetical protein